MTSTFWVMSPSVLTHSDSRDKGGFILERKGRRQGSKIRERADLVDNKAKE